MKARIVRFHRAGEPEVLQLESIELGDPGPGEALVRHTAIGLNYQDIYQRSGFYPMPLPSGVGTEAAGVVLKVGANVKQPKEGERVCYAGGAVGAYAEHRIVAADRLIKIPEGVSDEQAAASMLKGMTVEYLLNRCYALREGQFALFYAAAGGVGSLAGQWGRHLGAKMIGVVGSAEKAKAALANGYHAVIDRTQEKVVDRVREITAGRMLPVVYDSVGRASFEDSIHSLAPRGYFVSFGTTTGAPPPVEAATLQKLGSLYFTRPTLVTYTASREELEASAGALFSLLGRGVLKIAINQRYSLDEVGRAHADLQAGRTSGSSIIVP